MGGHVTLYLLLPGLEPEAYRAEARKGVLRSGLARAAKGTAVRRLLGDDREEREGWLNPRRLRSIMEEDRAHRAAAYICHPFKNK